MGVGAPPPGGVPSPPVFEDGLTADDLPVQPWAAHNRFRRPLLISVSVTAFVAALMGVGAFFILFYRKQVSRRFGNHPLIERFLPGILQGILILALDPLWRVLALWLGRLENHRTNAHALDSLVYKRFAFMSVANYSSLLYVAFVRPYAVEERCLVAQGTGTPDCTVELEYQLLSIIITKTTLQQLVEVGLPWVVSMVRRGCGRWQDVRVQLKAQAAPMVAGGGGGDGAGAKAGRTGASGSGSGSDAARMNGDDVEGTAGAPPPAAPKAAHHHSSRYVRESALMPYVSTMEDYAELVCQWGFIALFGAAFPLVSLVALINNLIEMRTDAYKILCLFGRIDADQSGAIDAWLPLLELLDRVGVLTTCGVIVVRTGFPHCVSNQIFFIVW